MWKNVKNIKKLHNMMKGNIEECVKLTYQILEPDGSHQRQLVAT